MAGWMAECLHSGRLSGKDKPDRVGGKGGD